MLQVTLLYVSVVLSRVALPRNAALMPTITGNSLFNIFDALAAPYKIVLLELYWRHKYLSTEEMLDVKFKEIARYEERIFVENCIYIIYV